MELEGTKCLSFSAGAGWLSCADMAEAKPISTSWRAGQFLCRSGTASRRAPCRKASLSSRSGKGSPTTVAAATSSSSLPKGCLVPFVTSNWSSYYKVVRSKLCKCALSWRQDRSAEGAYGSLLLRAITGRSRLRNIFSVFFSTDD